MPSLPSTNVSFSLINQQLYRTSNSQYNLNDVEGRTLAATGNSGSSTTPGQPISISNFRGRARFVSNISTQIQNQNIRNSAIAADRYATGRSYVTYTVASTGRIGSTSTGSFGLVVDFASGDIVDVYNYGYIVGAGGNGGAGGYNGRGQSGQNGFTGGPAVQVTSGAASQRLFNFGVVGGGGGGGGGGEGYNPPIGSEDDGGGGGGGAGFNSLSGSNIVGGLGAPDGGGNGTLTTGGARGGGEGDAGNGGSGGNLGAAGASGQGSGQGANPGRGGDPGSSIVGYSFITYVNSGGQLLGPTVPA